MLGWPVMWAVKEFTKKMQREKFNSLSPRGKGPGVGNYIGAEVLGL